MLFRLIIWSVISLKHDPVLQGHVERHNLKLYSFSFLPTWALWVVWRWTEHKSCVTFEKAVWCGIAHEYMHCWLSSHLLVVMPNLSSRIFEYSFWWGLSRQKCSYFYPKNILFWILKSSNLRFRHHAHFINWRHFPTQTQRRWMSIAQCLPFHLKS